LNGDMGVFNGEIIKMDGDDGISGGKLCISGRWGFLTVVNNLPVSDNDSPVSDDDKPPVDDDSPALDNDKPPVDDESPV